MRYWRLAFGAALILGILWIITAEQLAGASADATVNAEVVTIRAPIAGRLNMPQRPLGTPVTRGEQLAVLSDPLADAVRRDDLELEVALATAERARLAAALAAVQEERDTLASRSETYRDTRIEELRERLARARDRLELIEGGATANSTSAIVEAGQSGSGSGAAAQATDDTLARQYERERVETLRIALRAAEETGVFLGDGYNDTPFAGQYAAQLATQARLLDLERAEAEARLAAFQARLDAERVRVNRLGSATLTAPASGLLWERLANDGEVVQRGQDVMTLVDCGSVLVTLSVTEGTYRDLVVGTQARFRSADGEVLPGTVVRLAGSGASTIYRNLAVAPSQKHLERFDVAVLVPALQQGSLPGCGIGQTGRAYFDTRPLDGLRALFD